jgi:hypothetical protein
MCRCVVIGKTVPEMDAHTAKHHSRGPHHHKKTDCEIEQEVTTYEPRMVAKKNMNPRRLLGNNNFYSGYTTYEFFFIITVIVIFFNCISVN